MPDLWLHVYLITIFANVTIIYDRQNRPRIVGFMQLSPRDKLSVMVSDMNKERRAHPEKYPYQKPGLYIGGIRWEEGDEIINGEDGLPHIMKHSPTL